jgi:beta-phosphoglucomutase
VNWTVSEDALKELGGEAADTVFSVGNGRFCTRGTHAGAFACRHAPWPHRSTMPAGSFTRAGYGLDWPMGAPDWTAASVDIQGASVGGGTRTLDLASGLMTYRWTVEAAGRTLACTEERFVSWAMPFLAAQRITIDAGEGDAQVGIVAGVDGDIRGNPGKVFKPGMIPACDERGLRVTRVDACNVKGDLAFVALKGCATDNFTAVSAVIRQVSGPALKAERLPSVTMAGLYLSGTIPQRGRIVIEKIAAVTSDLPVYEDALADNGRIAAIRGASFETAFAEHRRAMDAFWSVADVRFEGDAFSTLATRFAVWSTRIAAPRDGGRASIGPKNLTGDWYRGLLFWDMDIFQAPVLAALCPERALNHVAYRARLLEGGRRLARQDGYEGARYPFSSPPDGEERPTNLRGVKGQQLHVNLAAAYAALHTWRMTGDDAMVEHGGLEVLLETARFWLSLVKEEPDGKFHIRGITGPDELHGGVDDNYYTNELLARVLDDTVAAVRELSARAPEQAGLIVNLCGWTARDEERARDVSCRLARPVLPDGSPAQFAGFEKQPPPNNAIRNIWGAGDCTHKQADTILLAQVDPERTDAGWLARAYDAYAPLCTQTSSLSPGSHALVAAMLGRASDAERFFQLATTMELEDSFANTAHGIHGAGQGGLWIAAVHGFGGLKVGPRGIALAPALPPAWRSMEYGVLYHGGVLRVRVEQDSFTMKWEHDRPVTVMVAGRGETIAAGAARSFRNTPKWTSAALKAVILDLDGVIVSTDECHYRAWKELADELGIPFDRERNHALRGVSREESLRRVFGARPLPPPEKFKELCDRKNERYKQLISTMTPADILPGMGELIGELRGRGIKVAVASASRNAGMVLDRTGIRAMFDAIIDGSMVTETKPDPQGFTLAAMHCRALPWECVGVEDSAVGVEAIKRAGMVAFGVGSEGAEGHEHVDLPGSITVEMLESAVVRHGKALLNPYRELNLAKLKTELKHG